MRLFGNKTKKVNMYLTEKCFLRHRVQSKPPESRFLLSAVGSLLWYCSNAAPQGRNMEGRHIYIFVMNSPKPGKTEIIIFFSLTTKMQK